LNVIIRNIIDTIKLTTLENKVTGFVKVATQFIVSVETALNKIVSDVNVYALEDGSGNYLNEDGLGYYQLDQLLIVKIKNSIMELTESSQKLYGALKIITDQVNVVESFDRIRDIVRNYADTVGITEISNSFGMALQNRQKGTGQ
jgi:hypothetical protein